LISIVKTEQISKKGFVSPKLKISAETVQW